MSTSEIIKQAKIELAEVAKSLAVIKLDILTMGGKYA